MRRKKVFLNVISSVILQALAIICGFIIPRLIISNYGSNINGLITSITKFLAFITLLESGFGPVIKACLYKPIANKDMNEIARILKAAEKIFRIISLIFIGYIVLLCVLLPFKLETQFDFSFTVSLIVIISISTFAEYFFGMTYTLFLQAEQKTYIISIIQIISLVLNTFVVLMLIYLGKSIQFVKLASSMIFVIRPIIINMYVRKKYNIKFKKIDGEYKIKHKWDGLGQHIAFVIHNNTDVLVLTLVGDLSLVSIYSVYSVIINSVKNVVRSFIKGLDATFGDMIAKGEKENLNRSFRVFEGIYFSFATIVFSATLFLIIPFIKVYTKGINDANYIRPAFAVLMVIAELIYLIRQPYNDLVKVSGHFKQTQIGAWFEAVSNIVISFVLVWKFGLVGVAIGTIFAMLVRTVEFVCYTSKHILQRSVWQAFKGIGAIVVEIIIISVIMNFVPKFEIYSYETWTLEAILVAGISSIVVVCINCFVHKDSFKMIIAKLKNVFITGNNRL